jgi:hypothetical protein
MSNFWINVWLYGLIIAFVAIVLPISYREWKRHK